jgi:hypothetical protein
VASSAAAALTSEKQGPMGVPGFAAVANRPAQTFDDILAWLKSVPPFDSDQSGKDGLAYCRTAPSSANHSGTAIWRGYLLACSQRSIGTPLKSVRGRPNGHEASITSAKNAWQS